MNIRSGFNLGMSIAFSHGTANALVMGMLLMQEKGLANFILWAIPNTICMSIFGWLYHKKWLRLEALDNKLVKIGMICLQCTMLLLQLKLLQTYFQPLLDGSFVGSVILAGIITSIFVLWMLKDGLKMSIITDNWQGWITLGSIALAIVYCYVTGVPTHPIPTSSSNPDWLWGLWSTCVYVSAIIADLQHWRRAELDNNHSAFHWATLIFACLMALIAGLGCFDIPLEVRLFCIIPILGLATSTIDSIAVALHECVNKWVGTGLAMIIICFWWLLLDSNAIQVWNYHGVVRCVDALMIIALSAYWWYGYKVKNV